jgi:hypothetical protein
MNVVNPDDARELAARRGFAEVSTRIDTLPTHKQFCVEILVLTGPTVAGVHDRAPGQ